MTRERTEEKTMGHGMEMVQEDSEESLTVCPI